MALSIANIGSSTLLTTEEDVINAAYLLINQGGVDSQASSGIYGGAAMTLFNMISYSTLAENNWRFCTKIQVLSQDANYVPPPYSPFNAAYFLPSDFLSLYKLNPEGIYYDIYENQIRTYSTPNLTLEYTHWVPVSKWPSYFSIYLVLKLASYLCLSVAINETQKKDLDQKLEMAARIAFQRESQNAPRPGMKNFQAINARFATGCPNGILSGTSS